MWVESLKEARHVATYRIALFVLYQHWKTNKPVLASNVALKALGVPRRSKYRAIRELERLGLIRVEWRFFVLVDGPIKTIADLKGGVLATNAFGSAVDIAKFRDVT